MGGGAAIGSTLGAIGGAVGGFLTGGPVGAIVMGAAGGVQGGLQGNNVDQADEAREKQNAEMARQAELTKQANYRQAVDALARVANQGIGTQVAQLSDLQKDASESALVKKMQHTPYQLAKNDVAPRADVGKAFHQLRQTPAYGKPVT